MLIDLVMLIFRTALTGNNVSLPLLYGQQTRTQEALKSKVKTCLGSWTDPDYKYSEISYIKHTDSYLSREKNLIRTIVRLGVKGCLPCLKPECRDVKQCTMREAWMLTQKNFKKNPNISSADSG